MRFEIYGTDGAPYRFEQDEAFRILRGDFGIESELRLVKNTDGMMEIWAEDDECLAKERFDIEDMNCDVNPYTGEIFLEDETVVGIIDEDGDCRWEWKVNDSFNQLQLNEITHKLASFIDDEWEFYHDAHERDHLLAFVRSEGFDPEPDDESDEA